MTDSDPHGSATLARTLAIASAVVIGLAWPLNLTRYWSLLSTADVLRSLAPLPGAIALGAAIVWWTSRRRLAAHGHPRLSVRAVLPLFLVFQLLAVVLDVLAGASGQRTVGPIMAVLRALGAASWMSDVAWMTTILSVQQMLLCWLLPWLAARATLALCLRRGAGGPPSAWAPSAAAFVASATAVFYFWKLFVASAGLNQVALPDARLAPLVVDLYVVPLITAAIVAAVLSRWAPLATRSLGAGRAVALGSAICALTIGFAVLLLIVALWLLPPLTGLKLLSLVVGKPLPMLALHASLVCLSAVVLARLLLRPRPRAAQPAVV
ncbi:hypothetical protein CEG14_10410 [Bordetella genomosp. 1]|uniref:Uncharacterized protein n=1 Tax=Bordetella genomosp. 1 TaxID=1395607 RepID=A0A261SDK1_9BORD|nr:hypothetical protein [Bordetella genomosp. 1]OZI35488.1 hypothetical protein CEG14_10410 [Bordetella genomosp. 1]